MEENWTNLFFLFFQTLARTLHYTFLHNVVNSLCILFHIYCGEHNCFRDLLCPINQWIDFALLSMCTLAKLLTGKEKIRLSLSLGLGLDLPAAMAPINRLSLLITSAPEPCLPFYRIMSCIKYYLYCTFFSYVHIKSRGGPRTLGKEKRSRSTAFWLILVTHFFFLFWSAKNTLPLQYISGLFFVFFSSKMFI